MTMADHGADVIMVEPKNGVGEPVRAMGARAPDGTAVWFRNIARGKRSIALDLKSKDDLAMFLKLADEADVIVEAFRPGVVARLGIGYDAIAARNPRIVYCSISAFGQNGPLRDKPSHDLGVQALAGTLELSRGFVDDKPNMPNLVAADMASSLTALSAILMALLARERTRQGRVYRHRHVRLADRLDAQCRRQRVRRGSCAGAAPDAELWRSGDEPHL